jgi:hypothetical protein
MSSDGEYPDAGETEPNLITSHLSRRVTWEGYDLRVEIYRLDDRPGWTLEVINEEGASIVWDAVFESDRDADAAFRHTLAKEGIAAFLDQTNVVPFRRPLH